MVDDEVTWSFRNREVGRIATELRRVVVEVVHLVNGDASLIKTASVRLAGVCGQVGVGISVMLLLERGEGRKQQLC